MHCEFTSDFVTALSRARSGALSKKVFVLVVVIVLKTIKSKIFVDKFEYFYFVSKLEKCKLFFSN